MSQHSTFLDVRSSARGNRWVERLTPRQANIALDMAQSHGIAEIIARVIAARGVTADAAPAHLDPTIRALMPDPSVITDLNSAARRIVDAIENRERVAIFGDYDVDGAASSALLARYLRHFGIAADIYIPDRIFEGYGPNAPALHKLAETADLIVTVDCGTNSGAAFDTLKDRDVDIVVLDHHQPGEPTPEVAAVVNPNREDDLSGLGYLCAAGVVFMTLVDVSRQLRASGRSDLPDLMAMLDLVALATVCDVVPLVALNRALVAKGLIVARALRNPGLAALAETARIGEPVAPFHFGFVLGPRINAGGRIGNAALGAQLLSTDDADDAARIAAELDALNAERQAIEKRMVDEARADAEREMASANPPAVIVGASRDWHAGIVGLIAARLREATRRPAFAIAFDANGIGTGSGRSIAGFDLGRLVRDAVEAGLLEKGGGHAMAAGITVAEDRLAALRAFLEDKAGAAVTDLVDMAVLEIDGALSSGGVTEALVATLDQAGPFGAGNPEPVFAFPRHTIASARPVGQGHLKLSLRGVGLGSVDAIAFRVAGEPLGRLLTEHVGRALHVAGTVSINHFNGRRIPQVRVIDAALPDQ